MNIDLDIREPEEIAGLTGKIEKVEIQPLRKNTITPNVFQVERNLQDEIKSMMITNKLSQTSFLPTRILVVAKNSKGREVIRELIDFVFQRSK